jgi:hypothetical protein
MKGEVGNNKVEEKIKKLKILFINVYIIHMYENMNSMSVLNSFLSFQIQVLTFSQEILA